DRRTVAPIDGYDVSVECAGVGEVSVERGRTVFVDGARGQADGDIRWRHVVDGGRRADAGRGAAAAVGDRDADRIVAVLQVLMRDVERGHTGGQVDILGVAVAPVNGDGVGIERTGISEATAQRRRVILVDRGRRQADGDIRRGDVVDRGVFGHDCGV